MPLALRTVPPEVSAKKSAGAPCTHQFLDTLTVQTTKIKPGSHHRPHRQPQRRRTTPWSSFPATVNTMAKLEQSTARDTDQPHEGRSPNPLRQIELHALAAVIFHALGDDSEALRYANASAALASAEGSSESDNWRLPKAAGWLIARAEEDPAARVRILKRSCCKYDSRGPLEGRLALQASTAYLELAEPELAAYFLARATEDAGSRRFTDHFPNSVHWGQVDALLESARVTEQELRNAGASLRKLGYLPEPEHGQRFRWIDEQWSRIGSDNPDLVSPPPRRV